MIGNQNNHLKGKFEINERRKKVARMLSKSMTYDEIASQLGVGTMTICRDVKVLKKLSQNFIFDLTKSDLPFYYQQCLEGIEAVLERAWDIVDNPNISKSTAHKLLALRVIIEANTKKFELYERGPQTMHLQSLEEKIVRIENNNGNSHNKKIN